MSNRNKINLKITEEGKKFIRGVCSKGDKGLLSGKLTKPLPFSSPAVPSSKIWECKIKDPNSDDPNKMIENGNELAEAIIFWYEKYAAQYNLDANILAAQAYVESNFRMWVYNESISTASGICQFIMTTVYDVIVVNQRRHITSRDREDIDKITKDLRNPNLLQSYQVGGENSGDARYNRPILHQNVIDNPDVMIRAQFKYMKFISSRCNNLASTSLFVYNRGISFASKTYSGAIQRATRRGGGYENEGINYVLKTFIVLGDRTNKLNAKFGTNIGVRPKPDSYYFGYDNLFDGIDVYKPNPNFDAFKANVAESEALGFEPSEFEADSVTKDLSDQTDRPYRFIFFPEKDFNRSPRIENKLQIVLHHTVSGDNVAGDINWWQQKGEKIATSFIISRAGEILQLFSTDYWAFHIGVSHVNNRFLQENSIGIELSSWGGLLQSDGLWYPARIDGDTQKQIANTRVNPIPNNKVIIYTEYNQVGGYHGFTAFEKYTQEQIDSAKLVIETISKKHTNIDLTYKGADMWGVIENNQWKPDPRALGKEGGVWSHTSFRADKSDAHPQPELIQMLQSLSRPT
jgi:N-acetyl-anhydromuramyl-L-alanine amidase AmpD